MKNRPGDTLGFLIMQDKVIVVSGGAGGIGAEVTNHLASQGARVVIADLNLPATSQEDDQPHQHYL